MVFANKGAFEQLRSVITCTSHGRETGGGLFGTINGSKLTISEATFATKDRQRASCRIDLERLERQERAHQADGDGVVLLGTWHLEPGHGDLKPSKADLRHWVDMVSRGRRPHFVGATIRRRNAWSLGWDTDAANLRAHVFSRTATGGVDCSAVVDLKPSPWMLP